MFCPGDEVGWATPKASGWDPGGRKEFTTVRFGLPCPGLASWSAASDLGGLLPSASISNMET